MPGPSLLKRPEKLSSLAVETVDDAAAEPEKASSGQKSGQTSGGQKSGGQKSGGQRSGGQKSGGPLRDSGSAGRRSARAKKRSPYAVAGAGPSSSGLSKHMEDAHDTTEGHHHLFDAISLHCQYILSVKNTTLNIQCTRHIHKHVMKHLKHFK